MARDDRAGSGGDFPRPNGLEDQYRATEREVLDRINLQVAAGDSIDEILAFIFAETRGVMPCDRIGLALLEEGGRRVVAHVALAEYEPLFLHKDYSADLDSTSLGRVLRSGEPRIIRDLQAYGLARPNSESTRLLLREGVRSSMTCPLAVRGRKLGFLFRSSRFPGAYGEREVALHMKMADRLGQAVEKAWRIEQLQATTRAYTEMLGFVAHELKSPLASIITEGNVLSGGYLGDLAPPQAAHIEKIVRKAEYLLGLTRDYLDLARIEGGSLELNPRTVDLEAEVLAPALELVQSQFDEKKMRLEREGEPPNGVQCDPGLLQIVAANLLGNAAKYGHEGGRAVLACSVSGAGFGFSVWNEGPGFPAAQKANLFRRFSRLRTPELLKRKGTGVGLYTSWHIVQAHGGRIGAESEEGHWARFRVEIPQPLPPQASQKGTP